jgi:hypothetical protein
VEYLDSLAFQAVQQAENNLVLQAQEAVEDQEEVADQEVVLL